MPLLGVVLDLSWLLGVSVVVALPLHALSKMSCTVSLTTGTPAADSLKRSLMRRLRDAVRVSVDYACGVIPLKTTRSRDYFH